MNRENFKAYNAFKQLCRKELKAYESSYLKLDEADGEINIDELLSSGEDSESEEEDTSPLDSPDPMIRRTFWLKKNKERAVVPENKHEDEAPQERPAS
jgi:hypothetical protein